MQMKEAMNADIAYLRRLNLQLVEQQMKGILPISPCTRATKWRFVSGQLHSCLSCMELLTLLKMGRYYNTTMRHYWDMLVK